MEEKTRCRFCGRVVDDPLAEEASEASKDICLLCLCGVVFAN